MEISLENNYNINLDNLEIKLTNKITSIEDTLKYIQAFLSLYGTKIRKMIRDTS